MKNGFLGQNRLSMIFWNFSRKKRFLGFLGKFGKKIIFWVKLGKKSIFGFLGGK
jgi:hypothetical protein